MGKITGASRDRDSIVRPGEFRVLALDGGGVRGALIAGYLARIEAELTQRQQPGILDSVDLIAGTSTGSIVAALLAIGYSAGEICKFYRNKGQFVFQSPLLQWSKWVGFLVFCGLAAIGWRVVYNACIMFWSWLVGTKLIPPALLDWLNLLNGQASGHLPVVRQLLGWEGFGLFLGGVLLAILIQLVVWIWNNGLPLYWVLFAKYWLGDLERVLAAMLNDDKDKLKLHPSATMPDNPAELLVDAASCRLAITAYDLAADEALVVKTLHNGTTSQGQWKLIDAIRSSTAAPFYFPPKQIAAAAMGRSGAKAVDGAACDGGVWANNPALVGYVEAVKIVPTLPAETRSDLRIKVLSIGTGLPQPANYKKPRLGFGILWWAGPFFGALWGGQSMNVNYMLTKLMPPEDYLRIDFAIPDKLGAMDVVGNFPALLEAGEKLALVQNQDDAYDPANPGHKALTQGLRWFGV